MGKKSFIDSRLWSFLIVGVIVIYCGLSFIICGRIVLETPMINTEIEISTDQLYSRLKDFERSGNTIIANSSDPWIVVEFEKELSIRKIYIEVSSLSTENTKAQIYYAGEKEDFSGGKYFDLTLKEGSNLVNITDDLRVKALRLDLTDTKGVSAIISGVKVILQKDILLFWAVFILTSILYCGIIIILAYFYHAEENNTNNTNNYALLKDLLFYNDQKGLKLLASSFLITFLFYLPYITNTLYAIDDYFLNQIYDINIKTLGYNFYSTGRYVESILAQLFYNMNIQPLTKPLGPILFIVALCLLGIYITRALKIKSFEVSLCFILIFVTNPFFAEVFHYSIIPAYSAFAILALCIGFVVGEVYAKERKFYLLIISVLSYICSLTTYQIFFPIIFLIFVFKLLVPKELQGDNVDEKDTFIYKVIPLLIYILAFIVYTAVLKISFYIWPPTLEYAGTSVSEVLRNLIDVEYWRKIFNNIKFYMIRDNPFNSSVINMMIWIFALGTLAVYLLKNSIKNNISGRRIAHLAGSFIFLMIGGLFICLGFSLLRPGEISSRSLTAFGIYQSVLLLFTFNMLTLKGKSINRKSVIVAVLVVVILFGNMGRIGRSALDQYRLNTLERSMVTRIVYRLEMYDNFSPTAKLVITGAPRIGELAKTTWADYNIPALQHFSKVFIVNEISGYSFQMPNNDDLNKANTNLKSMEPWPSPKSVKYVDGIFIVKLP